MKKLFVDSFKNGGDYQEEFQKTTAALLNRAWVFHVVLQLTRVASPFFGISYWQNSYKQINDDVDQASSPGG